MFRRYYSDDQVSRIYNSAVRVLCEMGIRVENRVCLEAMQRVATGAARSTTVRTWVTGAGQPKRTASRR